MDELLSLPVGEMSGYDQKKQETAFPWGDTYQGFSPETKKTHLYSLKVFSVLASRNFLYTFFTIQRSKTMDKK